MDAAGEPRHRAASGVRLRASANSRTRTADCEKLRHREAARRGVRGQDRLRARRTSCADAQRHATSPASRRSIRSCRARRRSSTRSSSPPTPAPARSTSRPVTARTTTSAGREHGLDILSPVDDDGKYTDEVGLPDFVGKHVFDATTASSSCSQRKGALLGAREHTRTSIRTAGARRRRSSSARSSSSSSASTTSARKALAEIDKVHVAARLGPQPHLRHRRSRGPTGASAASAPGACRCRCSTTPDGSDHHATPTSRARSPTSSRSRARISGSKKTTPEWADACSACPPARRAATTRSTCGSTPAAAHVAVLDRHPELGSAPADLYLEATDQHRGWFQSRRS